MTNIANSGYELTPRRLLEEEDREQIRRKNLEKNSKYPRHKIWVERAMDALASDDYSRMAFGVYLFIQDNPGILCCSIITTASAFAPHLELKNLMVYRHEIETVLPDKAKTIASDCISTIINHVQQFASDRGYQKLTTELFRDEEDDRHIAQCLLGHGFLVVGSQSGRYESRAEVLYLACDVDVVYGYDPFDYVKASRWIVQKHFSDITKLEVDLSVALQVKTVCKQSTLPKEVQVFRSGKDNTAAAKLIAEEIGIIVIEDYFWCINHVESLRSATLSKTFSGRIFVFDFSYEELGLAEDLANSLESSGTRCIKLNRNQLMELLYHTKHEPGKKYYSKDTLPRYSEVEGLLTLSDPKRFPVSKVGDMFRQGFSPIYIKLGSKGQFIISGNYLVLSYFSKEDADLFVWGYAEVGSVMPTSASKYPSNNVGRSDSVVLWEGIEAAFKFRKAEPMWDKETFIKHNKYNVSGEVVVLYLKSFAYVEGHGIKLADTGIDKDRRLSLAKEHDAYLKDNEVDRIIKKINSQNVIKLNEIVLQEGSSPAEQRLGLGERIRTACIHSYSIQGDRISVDPQKIVDILRDRNSFHIPHSQTLATAEAVIDSLRRAEPHIFHIAAHCDGKTIAVRDDDENSVELDSFYWIRALHINVRKKNLQIVVLACCNSRELAVSISNMGAAIVFFDGILHDDHAKDFTNFFFNGLTKIASQSITALQAVEQIVCDYISLKADFAKPMIAFNSNILNCGRHYG